MRKIKLTKLGSVENPRDISTKGESLPFHVGAWMGDPVVGNRFELWPISISERGLSTSKVQRIVDEHTFETHNSVYRWEDLEETNK